MLSEGNKNKYLSQLLRYSLWAVGLFGVFGIAIYFGSSLSAYNNQAPPWLPCVWEYDEDTTLEVPYRYDPISNDYRDVYRTGIDEWDDSDTPAEFKYITSQTSHHLDVLNRPGSEYYGKTDPGCLTWFNKRSSTYTWLNSALLDEKSDTFKESVAIHELGHFIGAGHSTESPAVMNPV